MNVEEADTIVLYKSVRYSIEKEIHPGQWGPQSPRFPVDGDRPINRRDGTDMRVRKRQLAALSPNHRYRLVRTVTVASVVE